MKKVSKEEEIKIIEKLKEDLSKTSDEEEKNALNSEAIGKIYQSETCPKCKEKVGELHESGICTYCYIETLTPRQYMAFIGGKKTPKKSASSAENGKKGGRPKTKQQTINQ